MDAAVSSSQVQAPVAAPPVTETPTQAPTEIRRAADERWAQLKAGFLQGGEDPQTPAQPETPAAATAPETAPVEPPKGKELGELKPPVARNKRERLLETMARQPIESELQQLRSQLQQEQLQRQQFVERSRQLYSEGKIDEALSTVFGQGVSLEAIQRSYLANKGATPKDSPEVAAIKQELQQLKAQQAQEQQRRQQIHQQRLQRQQQEQELQEVAAELAEWAVEYPELESMRKASGFAGEYLRSLRSNPNAATEDHLRAVRDRYRSWADNLVEHVYPDLMPYLQDLKSKGRLPNATPARTPGVNPQRPSVQAASSSASITERGPSNPVDENPAPVLKQGDSADAGQRVFGSEHERWAHLKSKYGFA